MADSGDKLEAEISVEEAARLLGLTGRSVINYLKSRQLEGRKVGKRWFVKTSSVLALRPPNTPLADVKLPPLEDPRSRAQAEREGAKWRLQRELPATRGLLKLAAYGRVREAYRLFKAVAGEIEDERFREFIRGEWETISDDIGAGFYNFGPTKTKLYGRARIRAGRLVSRLILEGAPVGLQLASMDAAESIAALCRKLGRAAGEGWKKPPKAKEATPAPEPAAK